MIHLVEGTESGTLPTFRFQVLQYPSIPFRRLQGFVIELAPPGISTLMFQRPHQRSGEYLDAGDKPARDTGISEYGSAQYL